MEYTWLSYLGIFSSSLNYLSPVVCYLYLEFYLYNNLARNDLCGFKLCGNEYYFTGFMVILYLLYSIFSE